MCPHLHCVRILAQRLQPNHKIVDPCVMKNAARGICPKLGKLQEDLLIVHSIFEIFDWFDLGKSYCTSGKVGAA